MEAVADCFGPGPIVLGPTVPHLFAAGRSARAALSGLAAAPAWPDAPRVLESDAVLPERALAGDPPARRILVDRIHRPLAGGGHAPLLQTATAYLESGGSLEATARVLFVHPNTVRYRLGRISDVTGYDLTTPREAWAVRIALALGRLARRRRARPRPRRQPAARGRRRRWTGHAVTDPSPAPTRDRSFSLGGNLQSIHHDFVTFGGGVLTGNRERLTTC